MIPQTLSVQQSSPPPSIILPFLTVFSIVILIFIAIVIFSVLASFATIVFIYVVCQFLIGPTNLGEHRPDLEAGERSQNQIPWTRVLVSRHARRDGDMDEIDVWREVLERTMAERKVLRRQTLEKIMASPVSYGSFVEATARKFIDCAICLEDFENEELCQIFPVCNHMFHYSCIHLWLKKNMTCPICRCSIGNEKY